MPDLREKVRRACGGQGQMTLREKLDALAAPCTCHDDYKRRGREDPSCRHHDERDAILAAARLALEHAAELCEKEYDRYQHENSLKWPEMQACAEDGAMSCEQAIRAEAAKIGADA